MTIVARTRAAGGTMDTEANKRAVRAVFEEFFNQNRRDQIFALTTADFVDHNPHPQQPPGAEGVAWLNDWLHEHVAGLRFVIDDVVAEGDKVAVRWTLTGRTGDGKPMVERAIVMFRLVDGRVAERWAGFAR
jgi:predicted SnoaL-like aldol condensation-catalyzing enzyme